MVIGAGGPKTKFRNNVAAIELLREIDLQGREATPDEKATLAQFIGWGMFPQVFGYDYDWRNEATRLRTLLGVDEFKAARASTINAHYTAISIIRHIWNMASRLGFKGGRVLEPAMGVGHFIGAAPEEIASQSGFTGVELDRVTGRLAQLLYPDSHVHIKAHQDVPRLDNFYDLIIGNVPFGNITIKSDRRYRHLKPSLHDYFFLRALDEARPGGLIIFITSRFTMDAQDNRVREALDERADLIAAFRLPCNAFKANAGTEVVADIVILQKRMPAEPRAGQAWLTLGEVQDLATRQMIPVNEYFVANPDNILGQLDLSGTMYGAGQVNVSPTCDLDILLPEAIDTLPENIYAEEATPPAATGLVSVPTPAEVKEGGYGVDGNTLYVRHNNQLVESQVDSNTFHIIRDTMLVRDALREVFRVQLEGAATSVIEDARLALRRAYDLFVFKHGYLNFSKNRRAFAQDPDSPTVLALEIWDEDKKTATKADVFFVDTVRGYRRPEEASTLGEAVGISLNETGGIALYRIAALVKVSPDKTAEQLVAQELAYNDPITGWTAADLYLSGNVKKKLAQAREAAANDPQFQPNVTALEKVQPEDIDCADIEVRLGAPWIPASDVADFMAHLVGGSPDHFDVRHLPQQGAWLVSYTSQGEGLHRFKPAATEIWGTRRANFIKVIQSALDDKPIAIYDEATDGSRVLNHEESAAANGKVKAVRQAFSEWLWESEDRRARLHRYYNDNFNNIRLVEYRGDFLTFPGMNPSVTLRPHQRNAVWRAICKGALYAHATGSGKTKLLGATAFELRRLRLARKPAIVCLNANVGQVAAEVRHLYPTAKIITTYESFDAKNRKQMVARIATGDWDIVILTHDNIDMLPMTAEAQQAFIQDEIAELEEAILLAEEEDGHKSRNRAIKRLEKMKQHLEERLKEAMKPETKDDAVYFEETGIDCILLDEGHKYKGLPAISKRHRVKGISTSRSDRATNMWMRARWLQTRQNGRGLIMATATPLGNSVCELYTMQRYLQYDELAQRGIAHFDSWADTFGQIITKMEFTVTGLYQPVSRFAKFVNIPELLQIAWQIIDVQFAEDMPDIKRPRKEEIVVTTPMSSEQRGYLQRLRQRAEALKGTRPEKGCDNMLAISTDARKSGLDQRLIWANAPDDPNSKINIAVRNLLELYRARPDVTHLIFSDIGVTPTGQGFRLYDDIISKLVAGGVPADKIIDFSTLADKAKPKAMQRLRSGDALFGIGSTEKMGMGNNMQDRLASLSHLDVPWLPLSVEQRNGRIVRHGNLHYDWGIAVKIFQYLTEGSFDAFMAQAVACKAAFIKQFMRGSVTERVFIEEDTEELSPAKVMALASGNPDLLLKVTLDEEVSELEGCRRRHERSQLRYKDEANRMREMIRALCNQIEALKLDAQAVADTADADFRLVVGKTVYTDRREGGEALNIAARAYSHVPARRGEIRGFELIQKGIFLSLKGHGEYSVNVDFERPLSTIASIEGTLRNIAGRIGGAEKNLEAYRVNLQKIEAEIGKPFRDREQLAAKRAELESVIARLASRAARKDEPVADAGDTEVQLAMAS